MFAAVGSGRGASTGRGGRVAHLRQRNEVGPIHHQRTARNEARFCPTTPQASGMWAFYHPRAQEALLATAAAAGAEVRRGASAQRIDPGAKPKAKIAQSRGTSEVEARLVALCAGRNPALRSQLRFQTRRGSIPLFLSGVWVT